MKHKKIGFTIITVILILFVLIMIFIKDIIKLAYPKEHTQIVLEYSEKYNVEENLVYSIIKVESNFNINAESNKQAMGLMQIVDDTAEDVANKNSIELDVNDIKSELMIPEINLEIGIAYISELIKRYGNIEIALASYNAGIGTVDNWISRGIIQADGSDTQNIPYNETENYVRKVINTYKIYNEIY